MGLPGLLLVHTAVRLRVTVNVIFFERAICMAVRGVVACVSQTNFTNTRLHFFKSECRVHHSCVDGAMPPART